jgi:hypothetical protein
MRVFVYAHKCVRSCVRTYSMRVCTRFAWRSRSLIIPTRDRYKYKYTLSSRRACHGTLPQCTIKACAVPLNQAAVRDCSQELEALGSAAVQPNVFRKHTRLNTLISYYKCNIISERTPQAVVGEYSYSYARQHKLNYSEKCRKGTTTQLIP